ncbi:MULTISPECIES: hypothetical protein [unclassified Halomonas]|uniref:hypothetical protein n=1 Tax=unclassified Halomonas TaxID=2609666 RepID=UPI0007D90AA5|nr:MULTISPECIES: hypothetical protein [unclassified Halomonas]MBT2787314.1 hypothetical protein [Halomonas sp. ISL-106]MBT2796322.1 hypothetical protein [Halomonas sp. ISL-104]OAL57528.1 hypothetical protein A6R74_12195 [Halomonas sp. ALS9]
MSDSLNLNVDQLFFLALDFKKNNLLGAKKIMQQALYLSDDKDGPVKNNLKKIQNELIAKINANRISFKEDGNEIFLFAPHLLPTEISSHKFLYLAWVQRLHRIFPNKKIRFFITHEGGHSNPEFNKNFFDEHLTELERNKFSIQAFPRYLTDLIDYSYWVSHAIDKKPYFSLFFETVETVKNNHVIKFVREEGPVMSVHCSPKLPINDLVDITFVGQEARTHENNNAKFLPVIIDEKRDFNFNFIIPSKNKKRKIVVTAFTNKRIIKNLKKNEILIDKIINFLQKNEVEWHFIGHETKEDYFELDRRFLTLEEKLLFLPITNQLSEHFSQSDVYAYLPGFHGGDSGTRMAVEQKIPCLAMKDEAGGYIKYATHQHACDSIDEYFEKLEILLEDKNYSNKVISDQSHYLLSLKSNENEVFFERFLEDACLNFKKRKYL